MTRWDKDVPERWGPSLERKEPLEHRAAGGTLADLAVDLTVDLLADHVWRGAGRMR